MSCLLRPFLHAKVDSPIYRMIAQRPEIIGAIVWPYQCHTWDAKTKLKQIEDHYIVIERLCPAIEFHVDEALVLLDLGDIYENLRVVLDQPKWLMREGQLTINLFLNNERIISLTFSFAREAAEVVAYVGAIQGREGDGIRETYGKFTKAMHGMRPYDFLFELFRVFCRTVGVSRIFAVSEESRHHRSSYFGKVGNIAKSTLNYNNIWLERGGMLATPDFFVLGVNTHLKAMNEIPSNKRSMYRRRYKLLEDVEMRMQHAYARLGKNL